MIEPEERLREREEKNEQKHEDLEMVETGKKRLIDYQEKDELRNNG